MKIGKKNILNVASVTEFGYLLKNDREKDILLPIDSNQIELKKEDKIEVFVYKDNNNRLMATTKKPNIELEQFAYMQVKDVNKNGAFMDWGIPKDLLVPYGEQTEPMYKGDWHLVFMLLDEDSNRLIGSCKENDFVFSEDIDVKRGDKVELLIYKETELGMNAIVNNLYKGLIFHSDIHQDVKCGDKIIGYVKQVRDDGKIDLVLEPLGYKKSIDTITEIILSKLNENNGCLYLTDNSSPIEIKEQLGLSKKAFKRGLGKLYKQKVIAILGDSVKLL